jgi:hypothetical protein
MSRTDLRRLAPLLGTALGIALTALGLALVAPSPPAVAGLSAKATPSGVVMNPRPGERVRGDTVTIRVRARDAWATYGRG